MAIHFLINGWDSLNRITCSKFLERKRETKCKSNTAWNKNKYKYIMKKCLLGKMLKNFWVGDWGRNRNYKTKLCDAYKKRRVWRMEDTYLLKYNKENTINSENMRMCTLYKYEHTHTH